MDRRSTVEGHILLSDADTLVREYILKNEITVVLTPHDRESLNTAVFHAMLNPQIDENGNTIYPEDIIRATLEELVA